MIRSVLALCLLIGAAAGIAGAQEAVTRAPGAVLRGLDKINGEVADLTLVNGQDAVLGNLLVELRECRFPAGNPAGDAYAFLVITDMLAEQVVFSGWMIASAPALNALDHGRYDLWVLRCKTS